MLVQAIYILCLAVSFACAFFLLRGWSASRLTLLLWTGLGFCGIAMTNLILVIDSMIGADLSLWRGAPSLIGLAVMIWGLVGERSR